MGRFLPVYFQLSLNTVTGSSSVLRSVIWCGVSLIRDDPSIPIPIFPLPRHLYAPFFFLIFTLTHSSKLLRMSCNTLSFHPILYLNLYLSWIIFALLPMVFCIDMVIPPGDETVSSTDPRIIYDPPMSNNNTWDVSTSMKHNSTLVQTSDSHASIAFSFQGALIFAFQIHLSLTHL